MKYILIKVKFGLFSRDGTLVGVQMLTSTQDFEYEVVQVVSDFTTSTSIIVMPLVKIRGNSLLYLRITY